MENTKTKKALIMSVLSMVLCIAMLIGMTFAWFTDTASTGVNKIQAGTLDVQLLMRDEANSGAYKDISNATEAIFGTGDTANEDNQATLWEPGKTQVAYLAVRNAGNLALKYNIKLNVVDKGLIGALDYVIVPQTTLFGKTQTYDNTVGNWDSIKTDAKKLAAGSFTAAPNGCLDEIASDPTKVNETEYFALVVHMDEAAGNEYQGKSVDIDVTVVATQKDAESDSNGNDYDAGATYPEVVYNQQGLDEKINDIADGGEATIDLKAGSYTLPSLENKDVTIVGTKDTVIDMKNKVNKASAAAFEGVTVEFANESYKGFQHTGKLTYKDCTIKGLQFLYADDVEFIKCEFVQENDDAYHIWTYGAKNVTFTNCKFNSKNNSKSILCYIEGVGNTFTRTFNNCTFTATGTAEKSAIMINPTANAGTNTYNININNCTATGYAENGIHGQTIVGVKETVKDNITVKINGSTVYTH